MQFICPVGLYGAEMWILALAKNFNLEVVNCQLAITLETEKQNIEVVNRFRALGLAAHQIRMLGRFDPRAILRLARLLRQEKIDIIHTHGYKSDILGLLAARLANIKIVATPHGFENARDLKLQLFIRMGCLALRYCDRVAPLSEELMADMHRIHVSPRKIRLIMNGVDLDEIQLAMNDVAQPLYDNPGEKKIGYVGQLAHRKNVGDLIKTFDLLFKEHPNVRLILVGDGPMRGELERMAQSLPSASRIEFLGFRKDRLRIVREFDLFSMTSSLEGIPRCMMEAMSMGVAVAAFRIPGVDKLIIHENTGLMAEFGDVKSLKYCWERLLFDHEYAKPIARKGRDRILKNFSAKRMADEYLSLYQGLMNP